MKKIATIIVLILLAATAYVFMQSSEYRDGSSAVQNTKVQGTQTAKNTDIEGTTNTGGVFENVGEGQRALDEDGEIRPAVDLYDSADAAIKAIVKAAEDYDDIVLEQFAELPESCTWCSEFYGRVNEMMLSTTDEDAKSYYAEVLSVSGRVENIATLMNAVREAQSELNAEIFAEAIEIAIGGEELVAFLADNINDENELLAESSLAALTNHGTRTAVEEIYNHTIKNGDPDGFYSLGIGLGEIIPEDESFPFLGELVKKRDSYSHLAVKAFLNSGDPGLQKVVDLISNLPQDDSTRKLLVDAVDHVAFDDDTERYINEVAKNNQNPIVQQFVQDVRDELEFELEQ